MLFNTFDMEIGFNNLELQLYTFNIYFGLECGRASLVPKTWLVAKENFLVQVQCLKYEQTLFFMSIAKFSCILISNFKLHNGNGTVIPSAFLNRYTHSFFLSYRW